MFQKHFAFQKIQIFNVTVNKILTRYLWHTETNLNHWTTTVYLIKCRYSYHNVREEQVCVESNACVQVSRFSTVRRDRLERGSTTHSSPRRLDLPTRPNHPCWVKRFDNTFKRMFFITYFWVCLNNIICKRQNSIKLNLYIIFSKTIPLSYLSEHWV